VLVEEPISKGVRSGASPVAVGAITSVLAELQLLVEPRVGVRLRRLVEDQVIVQAAGPRMKVVPE
jgi:hypothetical protein